MCLFRSFFFFQAEDGIRDHCVTGVQTCALPISAEKTSEIGGTQPGIPAEHERKAQRRERSCAGVVTGIPRDRDTWGPEGTRSEERRVGKECRSRWSPGHEKRKIRTQTKEHDSET